MRTTLDLDDGLLRAAKRRAADGGGTLTALLEEALRQFLRPRPQRQRRFRLRLPTFRSGLQPGVDLDDRDALYDRMEGRR